MRVHHGDGIWARLLTCCWLGDKQRGYLCLGMALGSSSRLLQVVVLHKECAGVWEGQSRAQREWRQRDKGR